MDEVGVIGWSPSRNSQIFVAVRGQSGKVNLRGMLCQRITESSASPVNPEPGHRFTLEEIGVSATGSTDCMSGLRARPFLSDLNDRKRATQVEFHFSHLCQRLVFSLQQLNRSHAADV